MVKGYYVDQEISTIFNLQSLDEGPRKELEFIPAP